MDAHISHAPLAQSTPRHIRSPVDTVVCALSCHREKRALDVKYAKRWSPSIPALVRAVSQNSEPSRLAYFCWIKFYLRVCSCSVSCYKQHKGESQKVKNWTIDGGQLDSCGSKSKTAETQDVNADKHAKTALSEGLCPLCQLEKAWLIVM